MIARCKPAQQPVHPRVCGERAVMVMSSCALIGSSPRVRGTRPPAPPMQIPGRFIPACAGNAALLMVEPGSAAVHPRVCGERSASFLVNSGRSGSSPRVRGTHRRLLAILIKRRFIPACAGNACKARGNPGLFSVHPRVCGERPKLNPPLAATGGSSPRVRGTLACPAARAALCRFIPACAGNARKR